MSPCPCVHRSSPDQPESPEPKAPVTATEVLAGGGEMGALMRDVDWARAEFGPMPSAFLFPRIGR
jgi:hypothetical protein